MRFDNYLILLGSNKFYTKHAYCCGSKHNLHVFNLKFETWPSLGSNHKAKPILQMISWEDAPRMHTATLIHTVTTCSYITTLGVAM